jgi:hypothetical protein
MVGVAQLVEPRVVIPVVVGSNPIVHPSSLRMIKNHAEVLLAMRFKLSCPSILSESLQDIDIYYC